MARSPGAADTLLAVRRFVDDEVRPAAAALEHADAYPHALVARMRELGLFGALVPAEYDGLGLSVTTYAKVIEEICRGWMSLAGVINSHTMAALIVLKFGTDEQRHRLLPRLAAGEARGGLCLTEPHAGSDVQAIRTVARRAGDDYVITGTKMFVTNGREGNAFALLALTDPAARPPHRGMSCFIVEKGHPALKVVKSIGKLGYKGVDTAELLFDDFPCPAANLVGGVEGRGFAHVMGGLETGRINIAARAVGVAQAAYDDCVRHVRAAATPAPARLADMAMRLRAARLLTYWAAGMKDRDERCDVEAGMAKLLASETAQQLAVDAMRIHGEAGTLASLPIERYYRDTPLMIIGEGTNEIQRTIIARGLVDRYGERPGALISREAEAPERKQMALAVRQFADKTLAPAVADVEPAGRYPADLMTQVADLGLLGALAPVRDGGLGLDLLTYAMIVEELARGWTSVAAIVAAHATAADAIGRDTSPALRNAVLSRMTRGEIMATAVADAAIEARRDGEGWRVSGTVPLVDMAAAAGVLVLGARADDGRPLVLAMERGTAGVTITPAAATVGVRGVEAGSVTLDRACAVSLGETTGRLRAVSALGAAAAAVGLAQAAFEAALRYSQQRTTFGKPICQHQAVQLKLADMATTVTAARLLTYAAAEDGDDVSAGLARRYAADAAYQATLESMRIHGGYGYTNEFPVERYYRDAARVLVEPESAAARLAQQLIAAATPSP
jgi:alkylation response protein AidB-like acyl-CoA dehydrogenase